MVKLKEAGVSSRGERIVIGLIKNEICAFLSAIMFFTRIPVAYFFDDSSANIASRVKYLPFVGVIVGAFCAGAFLLVLPAAGREGALVISIIAGIICTGGFHEDGLADTFDALGGAFERDRKLAIMKDSRIGTYGTLALISVLSLKFVLLCRFSSVFLPGIIISAHTASRFFPVVMTASSEYVMDKANSKSKLTSGRISFFGIFFSAVTVVAVLWQIFGTSAVLILLIPMLLIFVVVRYYFIKAVGGFTGDILGAIQQIFEILFLLFLLILQGPHLN